ncbi:MAG: RnfABCDGE type electron transport complex subunit D [Planctomycetes bacterium]|nr:RnfABCDGE type electron transport complex subunit D [Planctomycetota bacterium]MCH8120269.1 RnfABCDGE type electron transport complex subunit D [Planctomycetota bacterium]
MKLVRLLIDRLYDIRALNKLKPLIDAVDAAMFGPAETTEGGPHIVDNVDLKRYMSYVIVALLPATLASIYFYGWSVLRIIIVSYIVGGVVEVIFAIVRKKEIHEGFLVTGLIFPLVLPPTTPLWVVAVGVVFGVLFGKEMFGGTGRNIFNPALVGRLFITIAFPAIMTTNWQVPFTDAITSATPLAVYKTTGSMASIYDLFVGKTAGSMGETCRIAIIFGGLFLIFTKVSNWRIPVSYIGTVFVFAAIGNRLAPGSIAPPLFQVLTGGLLFGALFMATDPVTSPFTRMGKYSFGILCGILTVLIRSFSGYVEGVMFSIVIMNALAPLIDHIVLMLKYRPVKI